MNEENELLQSILNKQSEHDEKLAYILNNQNSKLDSILKKVKQQKAARIWKLIRRVIFTLLFIVLIGAIITSIFSSFSIGDVDKNINKDHIAVIDVKGEIAEDSLANADNIIASLQEAAENEKVKHIILNINSPGGSPVQSAYIYEAILKIRENKPVYAVIGDLGASGAYYIASAATSIYAHKSSLVGSIGVISISFGIKGILDDLGVETRVITAGKNKAFLSPFTQMREDQLEFWQATLDETHEEFIADVKKGRGNKLNIDNKIFSGLVFTGRKAKRMGLVDELGSLYQLQEKLDNLPMVNYSVNQDIWDRFLTMSSKFTQNLLSSFSSIKIN